jgi:hypothetical protein
LLCGDNTTVQAAHLRMHDPRFAKDNPGIGTKDHRFINPLCSRHHDEQTNMGERVFWAQFPRVDPTVAAVALLLNTDRDEAGDRIVQHWNEMAKFV